MEKNYPNIEEYNHLTESKYKQELEQQKIINFKNDLEYLKQQITHYSKLAKKWKKVDTALRYLSIGVTCIASVAAVIVLSIGTGGVGAALFLPITIGLGSLTVFTTFVDGILSNNNRFHVAIFWVSPSSPHAKTLRPGCLGLRRRRQHRVYIHELFSLQPSIGRCCL